MKTSRYASLWILLLFFAGSSVLAQPGNNKPPSKYDAIGTVKKAICLLYPTEGNQVTGKVTFTEVEGGVRVVALVSGLEPNSKHGFHIHEYGDCSAVDASSAGGHFNPMNMEHGGPMDNMRHAGDLGNLEADANGNATIDRVDQALTLRGDESIIGLSVVVHKSADDLKTQPTGNSGPRIACGVIGLAK
jgi:superoxide dismutase, Cu-Zn family